eukprot:CAMPEP_0197622476 /NCGR_PEP_ID=MMETSP1338-20131121/2770_1 /TAXON_ID=43686 ORGANISM="Pelagodinium beii, Strain RCC1491" /NCGR_SAMPLE_ID=MMETSP1338 /ASSEMBLY_ACC=CAM_ASM_000754 /LENGTH=286 /DNA_ID=CAMNT_0043192211 /DNA_START=93 /DNA_END=953 /DNA_ORIENTATION=+
MQTSSSEDLAGFEEPHSPTSSSPSSSEFAEPNQTIMFFDWDDTLFPTDQLFKAWRLPSKPDKWAGMSLTKTQESALEDWQDELYKYLIQDSYASDAIVILTNSTRPWVDQCMDQFAWKVCSTIKQIPGLKVIYAQEFLSRQAQSENRGCPARATVSDKAEEEANYHEILKLAKFRAMHKEVRRFYSRYRKQTWKNIISIGDAQYEHDAAQDLAMIRQAPQRERLRLKTIITPAKPSITSLCSRLRLGSSLGLARLAQLDDDLDLDMNSQEGMQILAAQMGLMLYAG